MERGYDFNHDETWQAVCTTYDGVIAALVYKYASTADVDIQTDARQEALIALHTVRPERIKGYDPAKHGPITRDHVPAPVDRYARNVLRNSILGFLDHRTKGRWDVGRTMPRRDKTGRRYRVHKPARYASLDELTALGMDVDRRGSISWNAVSTDGLLLEEME